MNSQLSRSARLLGLFFVALVVPAAVWGHGPCVRDVRPAGAGQVGAHDSPLGGPGGASPGLVVAQVFADESRPCSVAAEGSVTAAGGGQSGTGGIEEDETLSDSAPRTDGSDRAFEGSAQASGEGEELPIIPSGPEELEPFASLSEGAESEALPAGEQVGGPPLVAPSLSRRGLGLDGALAQRLAAAAGVDLTVPWRGRLRPTFLLPDGARITAEARAAAWGRCPPPEYLPMYWPQGFPDQQLQDFRDDLLAHPQLLQGSVNPYALALERVERLDADAAERRHAALALSLYLAAHPQAAPEDLAWTLFKRPSTVMRDALMGMAISAALRYVKPSLAEITVNEGDVAVDLRVLSYASHNSASSLRQMLVAAAERGLKAVVVADLNTTAGAQDAENVAYQLKREGLLPADFVVIPGQTVHTFSGDVLAIFTRSRVPDGMTAARAVDEIHQQGGLAFAVHPGLPGTPQVLKLVPFDGYLIQPAFFEMFRTQELMADPELDRLVPVYGSGTRFALGVGYPYSGIEAPGSGEEGLRRAALQKRLYAASPLFLPYMTAVALKPIGPLMHFLNRYFVAEEKFWVWLARRFGAQNVRVELDWDEAVRAMMGLRELPSEVHRLMHGTSVFFDPPRVASVSLEYKMFRLTYYPRPGRYLLQMGMTW